MDSTFCLVGEMHLNSYNPFYIDTRYPVHWPTHYDKEDAVNARDSAEKVRKWIKGFLGF